ncbi:MAG: response regulator [Bdellovibrionales bacterium]|nr:response regulator [Bdellovibrionales bacterium]
MNVSLLLVDDDDTLRERMATAFARRGYEVTQAGSIEEAKTCISAESYVLAVIDLSLRDGSGLEVLRVLLRETPQARAVILTGYGTITTSVEAIQMGAVHYLTKPTDVDTILDALQEPFSSAITTKREVPSLSQVEWEHMHRVLHDCDGNISRAAKLLGMHRRSLQRKLQKAPAKLR